MTDELRLPSWARTDPLLREYYETEWGLPVFDETGLFERICLEGFQAGLSWATILRKRPAFREAFRGFDPDVVAGFGEPEIERLVVNDAIIRNRRKIEAVIGNARATVALREEGGLPALIWSFLPEVQPEPRTEEEVPSESPESVALARELHGRGFTFVGPVSMFAMMEAIGMVDSHLVDDPRRGIAARTIRDGDLTLPGRAGPLVAARGDDGTRE